MAIQQDLVNVARAAEGTPFVDQSASFDPLLKDIGRRADIATNAANRAAAVKEQRKYQEQQEVSDRMRRLIDSKPNVDVDKLSAQEREMYTPSLMKMKNDYYINSKKLANADPESQEYIDAKNSMDGTMGKYKQVNDYLTNKKTMVEGFMRDFDNGNISEGVDPNDIEILNRTSSGNYDEMWLDESGKVNYGWTNANGEQVVINQDEIPDYFLENGKAGGDYLKIWTTATTNASRGIPHNAESTRLRLAQMFREYKSEGIQSMAYDDIANTGDSFAENWAKNNPNEPMDWRDKNNEKRLKQELSDYLSGVVQTGVDDNISAFNAVKTGGSSATQKAETSTWNSIVKQVESHAELPIPGNGSKNRIVATPVPLTGKLALANPYANQRYVIKFSENAPLDLQGSHPENYVDSNGKPRELTLEQVKLALKY